MNLEGTGCGTDNCQPALGAAITGSITLAAPLPQNGTITVTPVAATFSVFLPEMALTESGFTFTMVGGNITAFYFKDNWENYSFYSDGTSVTYSEGFATGGFSATATAGQWIAEPN